MSNKDKKAIRDYLRAKARADRMIAQYRATELRKELTAKSNTALAASKKS